MWETSLGVENNERFVNQFNELFISESSQNVLNEYFSNKKGPVLHCKFLLSLFKGQLRAITLTSLSYWLGWCVLSSSSPQQRVSASRTAFEAVHEQHHARHGW